MPPFKDLTGQKFGRLTVIERDVSIKGRVKWVCRCDCGNLQSVVTSNLKSGHTKSCGCYKAEKSRERCIAKEDINNTKYNDLYGRYKRGAKQRNIPFNLTIDEVKRIIHQPCYYCGTIESNTIFAKKKQGYEIKYNGIDRVDNNKGYEIENVVPCCQTCNFAKHTMTQDEFYNWIQRVSNHLKLA